MSAPKECRICYETITTEENQIMSPCDCRGSIAHVHSRCLLNFIEVNGDHKCRICRQFWKQIKICGLCFKTTKQNQVMTSLDFMRVMAHIHTLYINKAIEVNNEEMCRICGQHWRGVTIIRKRKSFFAFLIHPLTRFRYSFKQKFIVCLVLLAIVCLSLFLSNLSLSPDSLTLYYISWVAPILFLVNTVVYYKLYSCWSKSNFYYQLI